MKQIRWFWAPLAVMTAAGLLWKTQEVSAGVREGLARCAAVVIPSLFPFMILAGLISASRVSTVLSRWIARPAGWLIGLPDSLGAVFLMSLVGGYPVGARMLASMLERREIDRDTAAAALCLCVNAGPSFLISAVGAGMFGSRRAGAFLLIAQVCSALVVGRFACCTLRRTHPMTLTADRSNSNGFVHAVQGASAGILGICAFVVAFSAIIALLNALGILQAAARMLGAFFPSLGASFFSAWITGLLEVTSGCTLAASLHTRAGFALCGFLVSFSSLSILLQVKACFPDLPRFCLRPFYLSRLVHGSLTALLSWLFWGLLPPEELAAAIIQGTPIPHAAPNMFISSACLIAMCSILLLPNRKNTGNVNNYA